MNIALIIIIATSLSLPLPILLDGVERKLKATLQSRVGPPVTQTLHDILKLFIKELKPIHTGLYVIYCLVSSTLLMIMTLVFALMHSTTRDVNYIVYASAVFAVSASLYMAVPLLVPNPFSQIGAWREIIVAILNEAFFLASIGLLIVLPHIPSLELLSMLRIALSMAMLIISGFVATGRPPFDIAEAEPEIASGVLVEFSGPLLALNLYALLLKRFAVKALISSLITGILLPYSGLPALLTTYALIMVLWILFAITSAVLGRTRVDIGPLALAKIYLVLLLTLIVVTVLVVI